MTAQLTEEVPAMCQGCWVEAGKPSIVNEATRKAAELVAAVYGHHDAGGNAHIVVDDWNVGDGSIRFCLENLDPRDASLQQLIAEKRCLEALLAITEAERYSALAIHKGLIP